MFVLLSFYFNASTESYVTKLELHSTVCDAVRTDSFLISFEIKTNAIRDKYFIK